MNKREAIELLRGSWFMSMDGSHSQAEASAALDMAVKCLDDSEPYRKKASELRSANRKLRGENRALAEENKAIRKEMARQLDALRALFGNITFQDFMSDPGNVTIHVTVPRGEYLRCVDPLESDGRYGKGGAADD